MKTEIIKETLLAKFDRFALGQTAWLHTRRTTNIDELTATEWEQIYRLFYPDQEIVKDELRHELAIKEVRSEILTLASYTGIKKPNSWTAFNRWMQTKSVLKKDLNRYSLQELELLRRQFYALKRNFERSATKIGNKAWYEKNELPQPGVN